MCSDDHSGIWLLSVAVTSALDRARNVDRRTTLTTLYSQGFLSQEHNSELQTDLWSSARHRYITYFLYNMIDIG